MPCCGICGNQGHNRRTCRQWQVLEATRRAEEEVTAETEMPMVYTPQATVIDLVELNYITPSTRNRRPVVFETPNRTPVVFENIFETPNDRNVSRALFPDLENIDFGTLFSDTDSDFDDMPGLVPSESLDDSMDKPISYPKLVECVEEPCQIHDCPICMEDLKQTDLLVTRCGHQFHGTCMLRHMKTHDNCPMCRGVLFTKAIPM